MMEIVMGDYKTDKSMIINKLMDFGDESGYSSTSPLNQTKNISLRIQNDGATTVGLISGTIEMGILRIDGFVIEKEVRGTGFGSKLISKLEELAIKENCKISLVDTVSFSAPKFYEKKGYTLLGEIKDYPFENESYYTYMKRLAK